MIIRSPPLPQERAARQAVERERLRQQNEAARQAARLKAAQEKQRQEQEERERQAATQQAAQRRQLAGSMRSSMYLQRLRVQRAGRQQQQQAGDLPDWAKAARPLPPLLPPKPTGQAPPEGRLEAGVQHGQQPALDTCSASAAANGSAAASAVMLPGSRAEQQTDGTEAEQQHQQHQQQHQQHQQHQQEQRTLTEEEQLLQAALASLDARMPHAGGWVAWLDGGLSRSASQKFLPPDEWRSR